MLAEDAAEEQKESQPVNEAARADVPSAFPEKEGEDAASYPDEEKYIRSDVPIEIEKAPGKEEQGKRVGCQMPETAVHERMGEDAEHPALFQRIDAQTGEIPIHPDL